MFFQSEKYTKIKKIVIYVAILILSVGIIVGSFLVTSKMINQKSIDKNENSNHQAISNEEANGQKLIPKHDIENIKKYIVPIWKDNAQEQIKQIYASDEKQVFLTFDDGPSPLTPKVLDILKEENTPATFFAVGSRVDLYPETVKREYEEGHYIANHGYTHNYSTIYTSPQTVLDEYIACEQSIKNAINNQDYNSYLFRFPGGSSGGKYQDIKNSARELLLQNNITFTNWNCLTGDAAGVKTPEGLITSLEESKGNKTSLIILMHDAGDKQLTVDVLKQIIEKFKNEGYVFKNFYDIFK